MDIEDVGVNRFEILRIISIANFNSADTIDGIDDELINDVVDAFKGKIFEYLTLWDRFFTLLIINNKYVQLRELISYIQRNILKITYNPIEGNSYILNVKDADDEDVVKESLMVYLYCILSRVFSLKYNSEVKKIIEYTGHDFKTEIEINFPNQISNCLYASMQYVSLMRYPLQDLSGIFNNFDDETAYDLVNQKNGYKGVYHGLLSDFH